MGALNTIDGLERQRLELEANIFQLQQSLYHWRTWEAEYDGLKEDIHELNDDATIDEFLRVGRDFGGTLVNEDEVRVIIGDKQGFKRNRQQVSDLISRRIDYVKDNVALMEKRLSAAETQLETLDPVEQLPEGATADYPMQEIIEELDEDGEVISSKTTNPGDQASELLEILKKAGVEDIPDVPKSDQSTAKPENGQLEKKDTLADKPASTESNEISLHSNDVSNDAVTPEKETPIVDVDESPEDAKLRREMLQYGLDEVGAVVAELELDDDASDVSFDDGDDYTYEDEEEDEEEDEYGRSTRSVLDEDYHQQMRELEAKLNARGMWNVGKNTASLPENVKEDLEHVGKVKIDKAPDSNSEPPAPASKAKLKKKVAFAEDLDIAPATEPPVSDGKKVVPLEETQVTVLSDSIVERTSSNAKESTTNDPPVPKKSSRFKSARGIGGTISDAATPAAAKPPPSQRKTNVLSPTPSMPLFPAKPFEPKPFSQPIPDIPETPSVSRNTKGKILADTLVERDVPDGAAHAPEPDELDEDLHRKEIATEFHRMRNRMMKHNGESRDEEPEMIPVEPEEVPKRISKFRAARMG
ncbi:Prefoldin subunit-domain-containing protein [Aspergillus karnatakaensis]|uniref:prefoldin-like protein n=1 Tax=Aspergillus karnatakaensis TaxID=1810916 RepID=UPI003CCD6C9B